MKIRRPLFSDLQIQILCTVLGGYGGWVAMSLWNTACIMWSKQSEGHLLSLGALGGLWVGALFMYWLANRVVIRPLKKRYDEMRDLNLELLELNKETLRRLKDAVERERNSGEEWKSTSE